MKDSESWQGALLIKGRALQVGGYMTGGQSMGWAEDWHTRIARINCREVSSCKPGNESGKDFYATPL